MARDPRGDAVGRGAAGGEALTGMPSAIPSPGAGERAEVAAQLAAALAARPRVFTEICELGTRAQRLGMKEEAGAALAAAGDFVAHAARTGHAEIALHAEITVYASFVRACEDEAHYEGAFALWRDALAAAGRARAAPMDRVPGRAIGFVLPTGVILGHTEVLFRLLESRGPGVDARIYVYGQSYPDFLARAAALGVPVETFPPRQAPYVERIDWLRERIAADAVAAAVWVSSPTHALYAFARRIAPVQVFWSLRYHPVRLPEIDGYITYGAWQEAERVFHGQAWTVCPVPLALDPRLPAADEVARLRARFPEPLLVGTLAREEKIDSPAFLEAVAEVLRRNPRCGYLWTGRKPHAGIEETFRRAGVADRCHFVGWVDTPLFAAALDLFLETFPLGCGITGYQALAAGVPVLSYALPNTIFGMQYWSDLMEKAGSAEAATREMLDTYPVLSARDPREYAELATRMLCDAGFREGWKAREKRFFDEEIAGIGRYARRFFDTLEAIMQRPPAR